MYTIQLTPVAEDHMRKLKRNEPQAYKKLVKLLKELEHTPETGTGKPKPLGSNRAGQWSRRITDRHRLVYEIHEDRVLVLVLSAYGHYGDK